MKNIYETPTQEDFLKVDILRLIHSNGAHFSIAQYRKGMINLKSIIDFHEFNENLVIFDDARNTEYSVAMEKWQIANQNLTPKQNHLGVFVIEQTPQPQVPVKNVQMIGTRIIYHNNQERIIMTPIEDWEEKYFGYLTKQKLDF